MVARAWFIDRIHWSHLIRDFLRISERPGQPGRIGANLLGSAYVLFRWRAAGKPAEQFEPLQRKRLGVPS